jgi:hypothetical protein
MIWLAGLLATALLAYSSLLRTSAKGGAYGKSVGRRIAFQLSTKSAGKRSGFTRHFYSIRDRTLLQASAVVVGAGI